MKCLACHATTTRAICTDCEARPPEWIATAAYENGRRDAVSHETKMRNRHAPIRAAALIHGWRCVTCWHIKPANEFHRSQSAPTGLASACKACVRHQQTLVRKDFLVVREALRGMPGAVNASDWQRHKLTILVTPARAVPASDTTNALFDQARMTLPAAVPLDMGTYSSGYQDQSADLGANPSLGGNIDRSGVVFDRDQ